MIDSNDTPFIPILSNHYASNYRGNLIFDEGIFNRGWWNEVRTCLLNVSFTKTINQSYPYDTIYLPITT